MFDSRPQKYLSPSPGREFRTHSAPDIALAAGNPSCGNLLSTSPSRERLQPSLSGSADSAQDYSWSRPVRVYTLDTWGSEEQECGQSNGTHSGRDKVITARTRRRKTGKQEKNDLYYKELLQTSHGSDSLLDTGQDNDISDTTLLCVFVIFLVVASALVISNLMEVKH